MAHKKLPLFPLGIIVYPFESLHLHVFEPRYRQLTKECEEQGITFGIPPFIDDKLQKFGTELKLVEVVNRYENGRMDIKCRGLRVFQIHDFINPMEEKLYAGGKVEFQDLKDDASVSDKILFLEKVNQMFSLMEIEHQYTAENHFLAYKLAHQVGLSSSQEYQLLSISTEKKRIEFLIDHLTRAIPMLTEVEKTKKRINMNGHFKYFNPLNF